MRARARETLSLTHHERYQSNRSLYTCDRACDVLYACNTLQMYYNYECLTRTALRHYASRVANAARLICDELCQRRNSAEYLTRISNSNERKINRNLNHRCDFNESQRRLILTKLINCLIDSLMGGFFNALRQDFLFDEIFSIISLITR